MKKWGFPRFLVRVLAFLLCLCVAFGIFAALKRFARGDGLVPSLLSFSSLRTSASGKEPLTVVLDAGHGGEDGGAVSASGLLEKDLNLSVVLALRDRLSEAGIPVVLTRSEDRLLYDPDSDFAGRKKVLDLEGRRRIAEEAGHCLFVSIHMNAFGDSSCRGLQVWYSPNHSSSKALADLIQSSVRSSLQPDNTRRIKPATSSIYLLHHLTMPAVLVECGFLSCPEEAQNLGDESYRAELVEVLASAILEFEGE